MELLICFKGAVIYSSQFFRGAAKFSFQNCLHFLQGAINLFRLEREILFIL